MRIILLLASLMITSVAFAEYDDGSFSGSFFQGTEVHAGTEFPFQVGAKVKFLLPANLHMTFGLGYIPEFYSSLYGDIAGGVGIMGANTAAVASKGLESAFVVDIRAAYSLDPDGGFYLEGGYAYIMGGGGEASGSEVEDAYGIDYSGFDANNSLSIEGNFHAITVHLGYLYLLTERLSLNFDVGLIKPVIADVTATANGVTAATAAQIESDLQSYLENVYVSEMYIPTGSIWINYLF